MRVDSNVCLKRLDVDPFAMMRSKGLVYAYGAEVDHGNRLAQTALLLACAGGWPETASLLLRHGASVEHASNDGRTALLWAAVGGDEAIVHMCLERDANAEVLDHDGDSAVTLAERRGFASIADMLRLREREWWRDMHVVGVS